LKDKSLNDNNFNYDYILKNKKGFLFKDFEFKRDKKYINNNIESDINSDMDDEDCEY
jgi:hypothetical protein